MSTITQRARQKAYKIPAGLLRMPRHGHHTADAVVTDGGPKPKPPSWNKGWNKVGKP